MKTDRLNADTQKNAQTNAPKKKFYQSSIFCRTSIILFCGFVIFSASGFGGTVALGKLTSITLLFAMITNLTVLPALLLQFDSGQRNTNKHPLIEQFPEFQEGKKDIK